ncbi:MAG: DUF4013 domain-containing protein [Chloroflexota bacterium]|nr:DUF4013 domain-containing protein [Chloroflexota bacterium]
MEIGRAFNIIFNDPQWATKLAITAIVTLFAFLFTPLLVGLLGWAVLTGYQVALISNIRNGAAHPLPMWDDLSEYFGTGLQALMAGIAYALPFILVSGCGALTTGLMGDQLGGGAIILVSCCVLPLSLLYLVIVLPMYALGLGRFSEEPRIGVFFDFPALFSRLASHRDQVVMYLLMLLLVSIISGIVGAIPCVGWVAIAALIVPINGINAGMFIDNVSRQR